MTDDGSGEIDTADDKIITDKSLESTGETSINTSGCKRKLDDESQNSCQREAKKKNKQESGENNKNKKCVGNHNNPQCSGNKGKKNSQGSSLHIVGRESYERINFLYQAAMQVVTSQPHNVELTRYYMKCLRDIKEKKVLRLSREMKRTICDRCNMLLVPGITASVTSANGLEIMTCLTCNTKKRKAFGNSTAVRRRKRKRRKEKKL